MVVIRVISAAFILAGVLLLGFGVSTFRDRQAFLAAARPAQGVVAEVIRRTSSGRRSSTRHYFRVKFEDGRGQRVEFVTAEGHSSPGHKVGASVPLLYNPAKPQEAVIHTFSDLWFNTGLLGVLGGCLVGAGLCNLWITAARARSIRREVSLRELREALRGGRLRRGSEYQGLLVALTFVGFAFLGAAVMIAVFASPTTKFIIAAVLLFALVWIVIRGRKADPGRRT